MLCRDFIDAIKAPNELILSKSNFPGGPNLICWIALKASLNVSQGEKKFHLRQQLLPMPMEFNPEKSSLPIFFLAIQTYLASYQNSVGEFLQINKSL